jgi:hypothetical protein
MVRTFVLSVMSMFGARVIVELWYETNVEYTAPVEFAMMIVASAEELLEDIAAEDELEMARDELLVGDGGKIRSGTALLIDTLVSEGIMTTGTALLRETVAVGAGPDGTAV